MEFDLTKLESRKKKRIQKRENRNGVLILVVRDTFILQLRNKVIILGFKKESKQIVFIH